MAPSPSDGADCINGGAGIMKKGNSCSGAAAAEPENAIPPIASTPKAAARRELSLNASRLNIGSPLFDRLAPVRRIVGRITIGQGFQNVCVTGGKMVSSGTEIVSPQYPGENKS